MPAQQTGTASGGTAAPALTAQAVIEMFAELKLPVCDDGDKIKNAFEAKRNYYVRCMANPDPNISGKGKRGTWIGDQLQKNRPELLKIVYQHFCGQADTALSLAKAIGVTRLTDEVVENLRKNQAINTCKTDDLLAERFVDQYMQERFGLAPGEWKIKVVQILVPAPIEDYTVKSGKGQISLSWTLPAKDCDRVEIYREPGDPKEPVYRGRGTSFRDATVTPGTWYVYRAYSILGQEKGCQQEEKAVCLGEVLKAKAEWKEDDRVVVSWELPGDGVSVIVFRSRKDDPSLKKTAEGVTAGDSFTSQVYRGTGIVFEDRDLREGTVHFYRIVCDFGEGVFTDGKPVQVPIPRRPEPPRNVTASYKPSGSQDIVNLRWDSVHDNVEYVVVRAAGSTPPGQIEEDAIVVKTTATHCEDKTVVAGKRYVYAVFTRKAGLPSREGTSSNTVDILAEVTGLKVNSGDGVVELEWKTPENVCDVIVRRSLGVPRDHNDGARVKLTGTGHAQDEGLQNERLYHYRICCVYRPDGINEVITSGVLREGMPTRLPDPVDGFRGEPQGKEAHLFFNPPNYGQVVIVRSASAPDLQPGQRLRADEVGAMGERQGIVSMGDDRAVDTQPDVTKPFYSVFTVAGPHAVFGGTKDVGVFPDVTDLECRMTRDGITLHWKWPENCTAVRIVRRLDDWPEGPNDPLATSVPFTLHDYDKAGEKFVGRITEGQGLCHLVVYAQATRAPIQVFSPGTDPGCRATFTWTRWMTLRYRLSAPGRGSHAGKDIRLTWNVEDPLPDFAGFALIANNAGIPSSLDNGVELFRWEPLKSAQSIQGTATPQTNQSGSKPKAVQGNGGEAWVGLAPIQQQRWARFYCKAILIDPSQHRNTLVIHPDVCIPISDTGEMERGGAEGEKVRRYHHGAPKTVICPHCFREFPPKKILFGSYTSAETKPGHYTLLDSLLKRGPQPPTDKQGHRFTRKLCPFDPGAHDLPFTAGTQASLVIGVVGAASSGKTTYIASLIKRFEGQISADLMAALNPVNDQTSDRYRNEFAGLFTDHLPVPKTAITAPPLMYDLALDGKLWGEKRLRAVTLALYDTAGENFHDADLVRRMVQYLRVASGVIFLVDPLQVPEVRQALPSTVSLPSPDPLGDPNTIIANVMQELEGGKVVVQGGKFLTPVAVVLTKCDVLRDHGLIDTNRLWSTETRHIGYFDTLVNDDMMGMMGEYVWRWSPVTYTTVIRRFSRYAFFGASATGCATEENRFKYVSPWRVEDPLLWLLAELGVIPTDRDRERKRKILSRWF